MDDLIWTRHPAEAATEVGADDDSPNLPPAWLAVLITATPVALTVGSLWVLARRVS